jgi:hypothetical protein
MPKSTKRTITQWKYIQDTYTDQNTRKHTRPGAPHNTTQYLSKNLAYRGNAIYEDDITEIKGTMEGVFVFYEEDTDEPDT